MIPDTIPGAQRVERIGRATHIYALNDGSGRTRYIGKTVRTLEQRFKQHRYEARKARLPVHRWLLKTPDATIMLIEIVEAGGDWAARERYWILRGTNLLNLTLGGEGIAGHTLSAAHRKAISDGLKTGAEFQCEQCATTFWRKQVEIKKGNCRFCSRACYAASQKGVSKPLPAVATERGIAAAARWRSGLTHCKRGHPLSGQNVTRSTKGSRVCIACRRMHKRAHRARGGK